MHLNIWTAMATTVLEEGVDQNATNGNESIQDPFLDT